MTLIELLVAGVISLITVYAMVLVMSASLGSGTRTIQMSRLSQEMRSGLSIITRELRRANYHSDFLACYGNVDCLDEPIASDPSLMRSSHIKPIDLSLDNTSVTGANDCLMFFYQRPGQDLEDSYLAAFRIDDPSAAGLGRTLEMTRLLTDEPVDCAADDGWVEITDPEIIDVVSFRVSNAGFDVDRDGTVDYQGVITDTFNGGVDTLRVERLELTLVASLVGGNAGILPNWMEPGGDNVTEREMKHFVNVRNFLVLAGAP